MPDIYINEVPAPKKEEPVMDKKEDYPKKQEFSVAINPLTSYEENPKEIFFETQDSDEKVILFLRRHPITNLKWALLVVLFLFVPTIINAFGLLSFFPATYKFIFFLIWYMGIISFTFINFLSWYFNAQLITNKRVVDIDFVNLFYKEVSMAALDKIQDITYKGGGLSRTLFHFGDVNVQTASEVPNIDLNSVLNPSRVVEKLEELKNMGGEK